MHPVDPEILTIDPSRHASIINSWPLEEADARHRRLRAENLVSETIKDKFADPEIPTKDVESLAYALSDLKKHDRADDKIRADLELSHRRVEAQRELASERASALIEVAKLRADAQRDSAKLRADAAIEIAKLRLQSQREREQERANTQIELMKLRAEAAIECARLRAEAQRESSQLRTDTRRNAPKSAEESPAPNKKRAPFAAANGAPYGKKPDGTPHTRAEFLIHLRQACADIYGFNLDINPPKHRPAGPRYDNRANAPPHQSPGEASPGLPQPPNPRPSAQNLPQTQPPAPTKRPTK